MPKWNPFTKKQGAAPGEVAPVLDVEAPASAPSSGSTAAPGLLAKAATPGKAGASSGASSKAVAPEEAPAKKESTGLLSKFGKKKTAEEQEAAAVKKTLKEEFKDQKLFALIGLLMSVLVLLLALFSSFASKIVNVIAGATGIVACACYFLRIGISKGTRVFFISAGIACAFCVAIWIYNLVHLITNFSSLTTWLTVPYTIVLLVALGGEAAMVGWVGFKGWKMHHGAAKAEKMLAKAQEFARQVG